MTTATPATAPSEATAGAASSAAAAAAAVPSAEELDRTDPLARFRDRFLPADGVVAYLDGNSLGRPLRQTAADFTEVVAGEWGTRLIRSWDERWLDLPLRLGDRIAASTLGAAPGQTVVADSTTVLLYKMMRAAVAARPGRTRILMDDDNFPTDRFIAEGIARECGLELQWIPVDKAAGITTDLIDEALTVASGESFGDQVALVVLSHVSYRSGHLADVAAITARVHDAGALVLWDLCHSAGSVPTELDAWNVDIAVGCTYKYLNGGPGSPAFAYVASALQDELDQPIQGWMGAGDIFAMAEGYVPAKGMRRFISGTPPILGMLPMQGMLELIEEAGMPAIREKSIALTEYTIRIVDDLLTPFGVQVASPRDSGERGSHVTIRHPRFKAVTAELWTRGIIPDFRNPDGLRLGLSPLSTSFGEVLVAVEAIRDILADADADADPDADADAESEADAGPGR